MNTASEPYRTALLITRSMSYSLYFSTATATATNRHRNARSDNTSASPVLSGNVAASITSTSTAAAANHFSCSRSSPTDRANLTTSAATLTISPANRRMYVVATRARAPSWPHEVANGCDQVRVAVPSASAVARAKALPTNQAAGRHRGERNCPVGKSRNTNASATSGINQIQLDTHMAARPPGQDPGAATSACSP